MKIHIFTPFFNASPFLDRCVKSVMLQAERNWHLHLFDDSSTDASGELAKGLARSDVRISYVRAQSRRWMLGNFEALLQNSSISSSDIIVQLDGDDWLPDCGVFSRVLDAYRSSSCWITYGNFMRVGEGEPSIGYCRKVQCTALVRSLPWTSTALRTFKAGLARMIAPADLRSPSGEILHMAGDMALMFPMLEMSGDARSKCLSSINYMYNVLNPINDFRVDKETQENTARFLRSKPAYPLLGDVKW